MYVLGEDERKGVRIEFLSKRTLAESDFEEKLDLIIDNVKKENILVLEESLRSGEKKELIKRTMEEVGEDFPGIEFSGFDSDASFLERVVNTLLGKEEREGLLVVGPSPIMEKIREERDSISLLAKLE
ncbi:hypothetical protein AKJ40_04070 [candidate division MSBL1 archaeon SCGC-AAA259M10]|uniref:DUF2073 domain-containing protein n=2 Tax=candidate division MSBL1 TaxID=215777 RepID=A0A656YWD8_9EURY|nr:hypothetical protein AKJ39_02315 [candidate division MSBL1 archaeon SCGC-AAA259J03]KXA99055.1 hypothetical protein AKJ40_04070 [candidate division MSBL1 archaeon SCGC-AAA259M10]